jgi:hypothetical protein
MAVIPNPYQSAAAAFISPVIEPSGSGATDTANIQAALNKYPGQAVYLAPGTFGPITATLTPAAPSASNLQGQALIGANWGTVIQFDQSVTATLFAMPGTTQGKFDMSNFRIEQSGAADGGTAINMAYFVNSLIENVSIDKGTGGKHCGTGINLNTIGTYYNELRGCRVSVDGAGCQGIVMTNVANSNTAIDCKVNINTNGGTTANGFYIDAHSCTLIHPDVEVGTGAGVFLDTAAHATTIVNPYLEGNNVGLQVQAGVTCPVVVGGTIETNTTNILDNGAVSPAYISVWPNSGNTVLGNITPSQIPRPPDQNLIAWTYDPPAATASSAPTSGTVQLLRVILPQAQTVTNVLVEVAVAGATLTSAENFAGLYSAAGVLLSATADQSSNWLNTGLQTMPLTTVQTGLAAGIYYIGLVSNGVTTPAFARGGGLAGESTMINAGLTAATARFATGPATQSTLPGTITMSSNGFAPVPYWAALS